MKKNELGCRESGIGLIGTILLIPVLLIVAAIVWYGYCEARKAYWDHQVKLMCEKDGGIRVYEKVNLDTNQYEAIFKSSGFVSIPYKELANSNSRYYIDNHVQYIRSANPEVWKIQTMIVRAVDKKILGKKISYGRVGGDFPTWAHESSFGCSNVHIKKESLLHEIFNLKPKEK